MLPHNVNINKGALPEPGTKVEEVSLPSFTIESEPVNPRLLGLPVMREKRMVVDHGTHAIEVIILDEPWHGVEELFDVITYDRYRNITAAAEFFSLSDAKRYLYDDGPQPFDTIQHGRPVREIRQCLNVKP